MLKVQKLLKKNKNHRNNQNNNNRLQWRLQKVKCLITKKKFFKKMKKKVKLI